MEADRTNPDDQSESAALAPIERLVERVLAGDESDAEWRTFVRTADGKPGLWRTLAVEQRDAAQLTRALARRLSSLDSEPELSSEVAARIAERHGGRAATIAGPMRSLGWAAAAMIAMAWGLSAGLPAETPSGRGSVAPQSATLVDLGRADARSGAIDAHLDRYLDLGQREGIVIGELPTKLLLESRALGEGAGFEVLFVRPIVERRIVPLMYGFATTDDDVPTSTAPPLTDGIW